MDNIELDNLGEDRTEQEQAEEEEDTSFTDNTDYDNIRTQITVNDRLSATALITNSELKTRRLFKCGAYSTAVLISK